jgi:hypothetical protein
MWGNDVNDATAGKARPYRNRAVRQMLTLGASPSVDIVNT